MPSSVLAYDDGHLYLVDTNGTMWCYAECIGEPEYVSGPRPEEFEHTTEYAT